MVSSPYVLRTRAPQYFMQTCLGVCVWVMLELLSWSRFEFFFSFLFFFFFLSRFATSKAVSEGQLRLVPYELLSRNMDINLPCLPELSAFGRRPFRLPRQRMERAGYYRDVIGCSYGLGAVRHADDRKIAPL